MRVATNKNFIVLTGAFLFLALFVSPAVSAQTFGGTESSSLYSNTGSTAFQNSALSQGSTNTSQATTTLAALQQVAATSTIQVVGAPTSTAANTTKAESSMNTSNEVVLAGFTVGILALVVLYVLLRKLKTTK